VVKDRERKRTAIPNRARAADRGSSEILNSPMFVYLRPSWSWSCHGLKELAMVVGFLHINELARQHPSSS